MTRLPDSIAGYGFAYTNCRFVNLNRRSEQLNKKLSSIGRKAGFGGCSSPSEVYINVSFYYMSKGFQHTICPYSVLFIHQNALSRAFFGRKNATAFRGGGVRDVYLIHMNGATLVEVLRILGQLV